jgi:predicted nucleic acid-binding protein
VRPVVSNTSPLISLAGVGQLDLLRQLYPVLWVPNLVIAEYDARRAPTDPDLQQMAWLIQHPVTPDPSLRDLRALGTGEAQRNHVRSV